MRNGADEIELAHLQMMTITETEIESKGERIHARHPKRSSKRTYLEVLRSGVRSETPKAREIASGDPRTSEIELAHLQMMTIAETGIESEGKRINARRPKRSSRRAYLDVLRSGVRSETPRARHLGRTPGAEGRLAIPGHGGGGGKRRTES